MPRKAKQNSAPQILHIVGGNPLGPSAPFMPNAVFNQAPVIDPLSATLLNLGTNPYMIGIFYIFLNLGGRFLALELTRKQEWFLSQPYVRPIILFAVLFIATRNLAVAFWASTAILSVLWLFANENSQLCLIPGWRVNDTKIDDDKNYQEAMKKIQEKKIENPHPEPDHDTPPSVNPPIQPSVTATVEHKEPEHVSVPHEAHIELPHEHPDDHS